MVLDDQMFKDQCLIIVGDGGKADEALARRRLEAGGRLAHFLVQPDDHRVILEAEDIGSKADFFTWQPPKAHMGISAFAKKFQGKPRTFWTKRGPDGIELAPNHRIKIRFSVAGEPRHVSVMDEHGIILIEMSGQVVVDPDMRTAETLQVDVHNTEVNAFGSFSWRFVRLSLLFHFLWQIAKISLSIHFEVATEEGEVPWFRNLLLALNWCITGNIICTEMTSVALSGSRATMNTHLIGCFACTIGIVAVSPFKFSEFALCCVGTSSMVCVAPFLHYYNTIDLHPSRRFLPHLLWATAQLFGTVGCFILFGLLGQTYAVLIASGQTLIATLFLPFGTAFAEIGMVAYTRIAYNKLVHLKKAGPTPALVGDQLYIAAPCLVMSAHAFAEACRLTATFAGVVSSGGWAWIATCTLGLALNLSARLGWTRFTLIQIGKKLCAPKAMSLFAPTGWSKFHDELKIYAGYFRFVSVVSLCVARAIAFGVKVEGSRAPAFNLSALMVLIVCLAGEFIEDLVVTHEMLPINPAGPGLLKVNAEGDNADPAQLIALENLHMAAVGDPWRMSELEPCGRLSKKRTSSSFTDDSLASIAEDIAVQKVVSLSSMEMDVWSRFRHWLGQPRSLNPAPALHGLRELPFVIQLSFVGIVCEFSMGLLALLVGAGYLRGACPEVLVGRERIVGLLFWAVPLPC